MIAFNKDNLKDNGCLLSHVVWKRSIYFKVEKNISMKHFHLYLELLVGIMQLCYVRRYVVLTVVNRVNSITDTCIKHTIVSCILVNWVWVSCLLLNKKKQVIEKLN